MKNSTMKVAAMFAAASALTDDQLARLKELNQMRVDGAFDQEEFDTHKRTILAENEVKQGRVLAESSRRNLASTTCLVPLTNAAGSDAKKCADQISGARSSSVSAVNTILNYLNANAPKLQVKGGGGAAMPKEVTCKTEFTCACSGGTGGGDSVNKATCSQEACLKEWYVFENARELKCASSRCDADRDNAACCAPGKWLNKGSNMVVSSDGYTLTHKRNGDWDSARASPWVTTGKLSVTLKVAKRTTYMMIGAIKKDGVQWNNHVHSGKTDDAHPDGWVWYSAGNSFYNYSPDSGSYKRWGHVNVFKTNDKVRTYIDADKRQVMIFCNGYPIVSWTGITLGEGASIGASLYNVNDSLTILNQVPGSDTGYGAWREWGSMMERKGATIYNRAANNWETARAAPFISVGRRQVTFRVEKMTDYIMVGCYRRDYIVYDDHLHSSTQGDRYPDGWVWYSAGGRFYNYAPYGGTFKLHKNTGFKTGHFVQVTADADKRTCTTAWRAGSSGSFTLTGSWSNLNIGRGMTIGVSIYRVNDAFTIVEEGEDASKKYKNRSACGTDACLNGWTLHDNASELYCKGAKCSPDKDNESCCHIGKWLNYGTNLKVTNDNIIVHQRQGDWDSARASAWITTGRFSVTFRVALMKTYMMIGAIRKDGVQWNQHVHSGKQGDAYPDGWVWYSAGNSFYNYVPLSGSFRRWGGPNVFRTNHKVRVYVDADNKQVFIFCNGTQVASWSKCSWGSGVSVGASFHDKESSLEILQLTPGQDNGFGAWREWGMQMERQGYTIYSRVNNAWESARATEWISSGSRTVKMKVVSTSGITMLGCYRRDYMNYEQHPHSGNQGDYHPEAWVWYQNGNRFYNYSPFGGSFKRVSTASNRYIANQYVQVTANASGRGCYTYWRGGSSGGYTLIAQWTNLNIGKGMCVGLATYRSNDAFQIVEEK